MSGSYRFEMDQKDIVRTLITTVGSFIQDRLIDKDRRTQHKEQCAERLAAEEGDNDKDSEVRYSDQAVLANLDWGIDALEEAINTSNTETKMAQLDYAEKMLQVCARLNSSQKTAGVPNFYLSSWAHLNLAFLWKLRNNVNNSVLHILEMFMIDPFFSRIDFAPELWKSLFLPQMNSIIGWYSEERSRIMMDVIPDMSDLSFSVDFDQYFNESLILSVRPEQAERIQHLEQLYGQFLDDNTKLFAKYYKDCMNYDPATSRKVIPMLPIAEPPMTPLHETSSRPIPDYVKFGPILPKSAGFSPVMRPQEDSRKASGLNISSTSSENQANFTAWATQEEIPDESEDFCDGPNVVAGTKERANDNAGKGFGVLKVDGTIVSNSSIRLKKDEETISRRQLIKLKSWGQSPRNSSPTDSPKPPPSNISSPKEDTSSKKVQTSMLRLLSTRKDSSVSTSRPGSPLSFCDNSSISSRDSDGEMPGQAKSSNRSTGHTRSVRQIFIESIHGNSLSQGDEESQSIASSPRSEMVTPRSRPPKDFVCPITGQIFNDPVTLETGQTYERKAIQEWMNRGNTTCPITRQPLSAVSLPKTNYVLRRLITSWIEQHPDLAQEFSCSETPRNFLTNMESESILSYTSSLPRDRSFKNETEHKPQRFTRTGLSTSPTSVISQAAVEMVINALKPYILCLCNSEDLQECEAAVLMIASICEDSNVDSAINLYLSSPTIVNGFMEILSTSLNKDVLRTTIYILSKLIQADESVGEFLTSIDTDFYYLADLLKKGLAESATLMYMLRPSFSHLASHNLILTLVHIISNKDEDSADLKFAIAPKDAAIAPKDAAIALLEQIVVGGDESDMSRNAVDVISDNGIPALLNCLNRVDERRAVVSILLSCIRIDMTCRNMVANEIELSLVLELFHGGNDSARGLCVEFLCELVQLSRRTLSNKILQTIKEEGMFSTMHILLVYLQMSPMEQKPAIATLVLQLDLLDAPRKMSIYREEAMAALLEALQRKDFPSSQIMALGALSSLSGHSRASKKPCMDAWLLKTAGLDQPYTAVVRGEEVKTEETEFSETLKDEERASRTWEKRIAFVLSNHEKGAIFKALDECFTSNSIEIAKSCLVVATWLVHMLYSFPDCGIRDIARKSLLDKFINVLQSSKNKEDKILAALAVRGFINEPVGLNEVAVYTKSMWKILRRLKKSCTVAHDIMKALINMTSINPSELWSCVEGPVLDVSMNGEILSMLQIKNRLISSHSDGTIKVWDTGRKTPRLIQEVREHSKAVTCLYVPPLHDKLYSGSLDKTIRVWSIKQDEIYCIQVHDVKESVVVLTANASYACFASQGHGVKVYNWSGVPRHVNLNKQIKCLAFHGDKIYCGSSGYTIQEVDLRTQTSSTFYSGAKKLLGKQTIHSLEIYGGLIFAGGTSADGTAGKVFSLSNKAVIGSLSTGLDIHQIAVNNDFILAATKCGMIEVWQKERMTKITHIKMRCGGSARITSLATDSEGQKLFAGTSDGKIQAWSLD
ncbi:putative E3 ubiquitin-protein ligase LIN-1 isoform X2 [Primulina eburnea]|uniref:putative E3 ubiquitin-protein ligase LIN-1 isoform X2 n=1 Tax=Primulina eburnea TaxID=1245227 RepID=UPI003C6C765B